jgi:NAD-dependent DNA ligase
MGIIKALRKSTIGLDAHGQPLEIAFRSEAVVDRQIDELLGIVKGVVSDGKVNQDEAVFLLRWLENNRQASHLWPAKVIYPRLYRALEDDYLDGSEEQEILELLNRVVGGTRLIDNEASLSTSLPFTQPAPEIVFAHEYFCFTGKFFSGTRKWCQRETEARGGSITKGVVRELDYLVIGEIGSRDWKHSTHGRKIEKAVRKNEGGAHINIVGEQHWAVYLAQIQTAR